MKNQRFLFAVLFLTALASTASGARFYVQPSLAVAEIDYFDAEIGASLAVGALFAQRHAVEIEYSRFSYKNSSVFRYSLTRGDGPGVWMDVAGRIQRDISPLLLVYRYEFPLTGKWMASVGASLGVTFQKHVSEQTESNEYWAGTSRFDYKDEAFTAGINVSVGYRFTDHIALVLAAKSLWTARSDLMARNSFPMVQLGMNCRL